MKSTMPKLCSASIKIGGETFFCDRGEHSKARWSRGNHSAKHKTGEITWVEKAFCYHCGELKTNKPRDSIFCCSDMCIALRKLDIISDELRAAQEKVFNVESPEHVDACCCDEEKLDACDSVYCKGPTPTFPKGKLLTRKCEWI